MPQEAVYNIALFASGNGTNVERICGYFAGNTLIRPVVLFCNNPDGYVLKRAEKLQLPAVLINKTKLNDPDFMLPLLQQYKVTHLVLAGFLALVPTYLLNIYKTVNIHPALLPEFGGKGMYGEHVHRAVIAAGKKQSGITVHEVDPLYDHGNILFQAVCEVEPGDTPETLAAKIHALEQAHFPKAIENWLGSTDLRSVNKKG